MRRDPYSFHRLEIRAHYVGDPANFGETPEVVGRGLFLCACIFQRVQRDVESDLVAVLEAVGDGLGHAVDPQFSQETPPK